MNDTTTDLLDAVDKLTKPQRLADWIEADGKRAVFARTREALLEQLRHAIGSNVGEASAKGGLPATRTPIDVGAFTLYEEIDGLVRTWLFDMGGQAGKGLSASDVLRSWFVLYSAADRLDVDQRVSRLHSWATRIEDLLSPPTRQELRRPCPTCKELWAFVGVGEERERVTALVYIIRDGLEACSVECRSCSNRWVGAYQLRALSALIDDLELEAA